MYGPIQRVIKSFLENFWGQCAHVYEQLLLWDQP